MKIDFEFETKYGVFRDAIHLPDNHKLSENEIKQIQQDRLNNWIFAVENPPEEVEIEQVEVIEQSIEQPENL